MATIRVVLLITCLGWIEAAATLVATNVPDGWVHNKQRLAFHNGQNYFLVYLDGSSSIVAKASADNVAWSPETVLASDNLSAFNTFDVHLVDDSTFDLVYIRSSDSYVRVKTCGISGQTITCDAGSTPVAESWFGVSVTRASSSDRIFVAGRIGGLNLRVYSADQTGDAGGVTSWTAEVTTEDSSVVGTTTVTPYGSSDRVLVIYQRNPGGPNSDGIYSRAVSRGGGAGISTEIGNLNDVGVLSNAVRVSDTEFHYILSKSGSTPLHYVWDDSTWSALPGFGNANTTEPALLLDRTTGYLHAFAIDAGTDDVMRYRKPSGGPWDGGTVADGGEGPLHTLPVTQMHEAPDGSGRSATEVVWAYRVANGGNWDLHFGTLGAQRSITGTVFEDVNYGGGAGRDYATADADSGPLAIDRDNVTVELYDSGGSFVSTTTTAADGSYDFLGLAAGLYTARVVNASVASTRPGSNGSEVAVQTFRADGNGEAVGAGAGKVGGERPAEVDAPANSGSDTLADLQAPAGQYTQSIVTIDLTGGDAGGVDFGFNFDTIVNTSDSGQGSLRQFILNSRLLTNADLDQDGLTAGTETSLFMIPSDSDPLGRPQDPNFDAVRGVAVITPAAALNAINDAYTAVDGTTQTGNVGDTNAGSLGTGGTVGTGADGVEGTGDDPALTQVPAPEVEIVGANAIATGFNVDADDVTIRGLAVYGFGNNPNTTTQATILVQNGPVNTLIEQNVLGSSATSFTDPGPGTRTGTDHISKNALFGAAGNGTVRDNLIGFAVGHGISLKGLFGSADGWVIERNEIRNCAIGESNLDGVEIRSSGSATIERNLIVGTDGVGIDTLDSGGANTIRDNTVEGSGVGVVNSASAADETAGIRIYGSGNTVEQNVVRANWGAGILVTSGADTTAISKNSLYDNGTIDNDAGPPPSGQIGIDLLSAGDSQTSGTAPFVTKNDAADGDAGGNDLINFPVLDTAAISGGNLTLTGWAAAGTTIEFFINDGDGSRFGEGKTYLVTLVEGSGADADGDPGSYGPGLVNGLDQGEDTVERFSFQIPTPAGVNNGTALTATGTLGGRTSEFSGRVVVSGTSLSIVKRAFQLDGTSIEDTSVLPTGTPVRYLLYINNTAASAVNDASVQDVLDAAYGYKAGSIRIENSVAACAAIACTAVEETAILAAVVAQTATCGPVGAACTDGVDADPVSWNGTTTIDAGDDSQANAQLDLAAGKVWAMVFSVTMQ